MRQAQHVTFAAMPSDADTTTSEEPRLFDAASRQKDSRPRTASSDSPPNSRSLEDPDVSADVPGHPAKFSPGIIETMAALLTGRSGCLLDPFAGVGGIHRIADHAEPGAWCTHGMEIEKAWADAHPNTRHGDSRSLPWDDSTFAAVATSPTYGNGMGQRRHHPNEAGQGRRYSYADMLGADLADGNTGAVRWGREYRDLHEAVWTECVRVLAPEGRLLLNIRDPMKKGQIQPVSGWHTETLQHLGLRFRSVAVVATRSMSWGSHSKARVGNGEAILVFDKTG